MSIRTKKLLCFVFFNIALVFGALFLVWFGELVADTPAAAATDCPSHRLFGIYCPFCGCTRAMRALLHLDIFSSLIYNPVLLPAMISFFIYDILTLKAILQNKEKVIHIHKPVWISLVAILALNWIVRNLLLIVWNFDYISILS